MNRRLVFVSCALTLVAALAACDSKVSTPAAGATPAAATAPATPSKQAPSLEAAAEGKGFTAGAMMAANPVYVFFDPQCPHCGHLWNAAVPLQKSVKFVWIPVALINAASLAQGGALLSAVNPVDAMTEHETSLLGGKGGLSASSSLSPEMEQAIKKNTAILTSFGAEGVPFIVAKNLKSGQIVTRDGSMSTAALADLLGVAPP